MLDVNQVGIVRSPQKLPLDGQLAFLKDVKLGVIWMCGHINLSIKEQTAAQRLSRMG
jgi:hypothetical protein